MDVLFVHPGGSKKIYQELAKDYSAIETPTWSLLLAESCRCQGYDVGILDVNAERLSNPEALKRIEALNPRFVCFVVYGQNPNSGTTNMVGAVSLANYIKKHADYLALGLIGSHAQALPYDVINDERSFDIVFPNEGVYSLWNLLEIDNLKNKTLLENVKGIGFIKDEKPFLTKPERIVPQERMDVDLPGYAWDLLPYDSEPLDLYRAHFWHAEYDHNKRTPFAALYTSLGCQFKCSFCMINVINKNDNNPVGVASNYSGMRFWSPEFIIKEFDKLVSMGVETVRIVDEMFLLNRKFYVPLCNMLIERGYGDKLRMWAYSRIDTIGRKENLELIRKAGIKWLALGIESANIQVRSEATKGKFKNVKIESIIQDIHDADIEVIANYIFGLPKDTLETMQETLDLSVRLCTSAWNAYTAVPLPGSTLYKNLRDNQGTVAKNYEDYSFHSYETVPEPTEFLTSKEILQFRDHAWDVYHTNEAFLSRIESKFGLQQRKNIEKMSKITLKRKILEEDE